MVRAIRIRPCLHPVCQWELLSDLHTSTSEASAEKEVSKSVVIGRVFTSQNGQKCVDGRGSAPNPAGELTALRCPVIGLRSKG